MREKKPFDILRIAFGIVWAIDACFKWTPSFLNGLPMQLGMMAQGQPSIIAGWINLFIRIVSVNPHLFAVGIAVIESALALCLIFDLIPQTTLIFGFCFSILLWSVGEGFGGPYMSGSTDIGTAIIYAFVFAALYLERFGAKEIKKAEKEIIPTKDTLIKILSAAIMILAAVIIAPYLVTRTSTAQATDMPPGMMMKSFELASTTTPIPTISFTVTKDTLDGWDLHVNTTDFTWTPQLINTAPIADQGHVHLYIDGNLTVLLGPWYHIDSNTLPPGKHTITVSLNANDHSVFTDNGQNIQSTQTLFVSPI